MNLSPDQPRIQIAHVDWPQIAPIWRRELWPARPDPVREMSSMLWQGGFDVSIYYRYRPLFIAATTGKMGNTIIGVNSGHLTDATQFRSRGLWIHPDWRGRGIARRLLLETEAIAKDAGAKLIWSYPRNAAWSTYLAVGYQASERRLKPEDANFYAHKAI